MNNNYLKNLNLKEYVKEKDLKLLFNKLYPICRSITGEGFIKSLKYLSEIQNLKIIKVKTGKKVLDWTIPDEWNINDAYVLYKKKKIIDFKKHNLHILNYSKPVNKILKFNELKKHLYTLPNLPNAIPYVHSYYDRKWGFCLSHNQFKKLNKRGKYKVLVDSSIKPGYLNYSDNLIKGKSKKEILFYCYLCHPQLANHELSGPLLWIFLYKILKKQKGNYYSYRFVCAPENIGAATFLHYNKKKVKNISAGYIINCVGNGKIVTYKKSRKGNSLADKAAINVIKSLKKDYKIVNFFPDGSDERQFCSPGFDLPIGLVMRRMFGEFKEYHNSLDNEKFINFKTIIETLKIYIEIIKTLETNFVPYGRVQFGTPQLSKIKNIDLYPKTMNFNAKPKTNSVKLMLKILNYSDGKHDLLDILKDENSLLRNMPLIKKLIKSKLIKKK